MERQFFSNFGHESTFLHQPDPDRARPPVRLTVKSQIPLNPPLSKGDFTPPFEKGGQGGFFILGVSRMWLMDV